MTIKTLKVEVTVEKETYEMGAFCKELMIDVANAKYDDGELTADEYIAIGMKAITSAKTAVEGITNVADAEGVEYIDVAMGAIIPMTEAAKEVITIVKQKPVATEE